MNPPVVVDHEVAGLDVTVDDRRGQTVQSRENRAHLLHNIGDLFVGEVMGLQPFF